MGSSVASKAAVWGMSEVLAKELAAEGGAVGVTILIPGPIRTNIAHSSRHRPGGDSDGLRDFDLAESLASRSINWGWATPADVGQIVTRAIRNGDLCAPAHPDLLAQVVGRRRAIEDAYSRHPITSAD